MSEQKKQKFFKRYLKTKNILPIVGLGLLIFLTYWNSFNAPFEGDEGEYAYAAWLLKQNIPPYENSFLQKPPMIIYTFLLGYLINPDALWPPRLLAFIFTALTLLLIGLVAKKEFGKRAGIVAASLSIPMLALPHLTPFTANTERFMLLPLTGVLALYVFNRKNARGWPWFLSGFLGLLALSYKQIALFVLFFLYAAWLIELWKEQKKAKIVLKNIFLALLGAGLAFFIVFGYFIIRGGFFYFWECAIIFNKHLAQNEFSDLFKTLPFLRFVKIFLANWWFLFLLFGWFLIRRPAHWLFYLGISLVSFFSVWMSPRGHYYLLLMPFWILLSTGSIISLINRLPVKNVKEKNLKQFLYGLILFVTLITMHWPIRQQFILTPEELTIWIYGAFNPFLGAPIVAEKVVDLTSPDDYIFIAGSEAEILYYAKRRSSSRFVVTYPLNIETPQRISYQNEVISDLKNRPPAVIVFSQNQSSGLWWEGSPTFFKDYLTDLLKNKYELVGGYVWDIYGEHYWQDYPNNDQVEQSSLLVYKKNLPARNLSDF